MSELSTSEPLSLPEWFETAHNLSTTAAEDQSRKMLSFFSALAASPHASSQPITEAFFSA